MTRKIAILGSTGSIGKSTLEILANEKKNFNIVLLTCNKNYKILFKQAKIFNVKNLIVTDLNIYKFIINSKKYRNYNIYNDFDCFKKIFKKKIYYVMSSIVGLDGLKPTFNIIKYTKNIAIANKETILCAWPLINKELKTNNVNFFPVDSEHFSIFYGSNNIPLSNIKKIYLTASGGPFYNLPIKKLKNVKLIDALKHPTWKMGKKISIDSATMVNKLFEVMEASKIFKIPYNSISILIHPSSYIHAIIKFKNGLIKLIAHDTTMRIPIFNTLFYNEDKLIKSQNLNYKILNNLNFNYPNLHRYPALKILKLLPNKCTLFDTVIVTANDELVNLFLKKVINFNDISKIILKFLNLREIKKYKRILPRDINDIITLETYIKHKINLFVKNA